MYVIVLFPLIIVPDSSNPIVESTLITESPGFTVSKTLEYPGIVKEPSTRSLSLNPINNPS